MKKMFPGYYRPSDEEFEQLWAECVFVFDANVLLNLYRYSPDTSKELLGILEEISGRLWLPHQFALEYHNHLQDYQSSPPKEYDNVDAVFEKTLIDLKRELNALAKRTRLNVKELGEHLQTAIENIRSEAQDKIQPLKDEHQNWLKDSDLPGEIAKLFDGAVGAEYSEKRLEEVYKLGKERYERKQPPGYEDKKKNEPACYGDLIAWFQIIDYAKNKQTPIIIVTNDTKNDWYLRVHGETNGPRPELVQELSKEAGVQFYIHTTERFMPRAKEYLGSQVSETAIAEVQEWRTHDERRLATLAAFDGTLIPNVVGQIGALQQSLGLSTDEILNAARASVISDALAFPNPAYNSELALKWNEILNATPPIPLGFEKFNPLLGIDIPISPALLNLTPTDLSTVVPPLPESLSAFVGLPNDSTFGNRDTQHTKQENDEAEKNQNVSDKDDDDDELDALLAPSE
jgi:hypothetical protein